MTTQTPGDLLRHQIAELRLDLGARASGYWWVAGDWLELVAFVPSPALAESVVRGFVDATRSVPLARADLGIVRAATEGIVAVSRVSELPDDEGSGHWLRGFGATRSVAVPLLAPGGPVRAVLSVAIGDPPPDDAEIAERLVAAARTWAPLV